MPLLVRNFIGKSYSILPFNIRLGKEYSQFRTILLQSRKWSKQKIYNYQFQEIKKIIEIAYNYIPYYKEHFLSAGVKPENFKSLSDIKLFPYTTKLDIKTNLDKFINPKIPSWKRLVTTTGGSTAEPMRFFHVKGVTRSKERAFIWDQWSRFGYKPRARTVQLKGREVGNPSKNIFWEYEPIDNFLEMNSNYLTEKYIPLYLEAIIKFKPQYMIGYVSSIFLLAKFIKSNPEYTIPKMKAIFLASENIYPWQREELDLVFQCPISSHYGHSEMILLGSECPLDRQLHFYPQYGYLELVDEHDNQVNEIGATGELVGTSFHNYLMPFIRYRTQDYGVLGEATCPCHANYPVLKSVEGRLQEFIVTKDKRLISICVMGAAHFDNLDRVFQTQYYQEEPGKLIFKIVPRQDFTNLDRESIQKAVSQKVGTDVEVMVQVVDSIPRTKNGKHMMIEQKIVLDSLPNSQNVALC